MMNEVFEKIIEKLEKLSDECYKAYCIGFNSDDRAEYDAYTNAIEIVKQASAEHNNGWIPCIDELPPYPKKNSILENRPIEMYLVSVSCYGYPIRAFWNGRFFTDVWNKLDVDAWKPLPEPYKEKKCD